MGLTSQGFQLPPGVSVREEHVGDGWAYVLRHPSLGLLGRLVLHDRGGQCHVSCKVVGDPEATAVKIILEGGSLFVFDT